MSVINLDLRQESIKNYLNYFMQVEESDIEKITEGDELAFEHLMHLYSARLYRYIMGFVHVREEGEEMVSDVFYDVWKNRRLLQDVQNMDAYIFTIAYRKCISRLRQGHHYEEVSLDEVGDFVMNPLLSPDEEMISREEIHRINDAISQLPPKCKHVFFLAKVEHLPYKDIADMMGISVKTINNHIASALEKLKDIIGDE